MSHQNFSPSCDTVLNNIYLTPLNLEAEFDDKHNEEDLLSAKDVVFGLFPPPFSTLDEVGCIVKAWYTKDVFILGGYSEREEHRGVKVVKM